nr:TIGR03089 family protein [Motilibacter aurantiacus]
MRNALTADPARPFVTFYDDSTGERVELSVLTFDNWVAKTANLLQDELAVTPGQTLALVLPAHWQAPVWLLAAWSVGLEVTPARPGDPLPQADVIVTGPESLDDAVAAGAGEVVALSLRPALLAATTPGPALPAGVIDGDAEVPPQGDRFLAYAPPAPDAPALDCQDQALTAAGLARSGRDAAARLGARPGARLLTGRAFDTAEAIVEALLVPLAVGGSLVLCRNADPAAADARRDVEQVDLVV